jgi:hypothetical protein
MYGVIIMKIIMKIINNNNDVMCNNVANVNDIIISWYIIIW